MLENADGYDIPDVVAGDETNKLKHGSCIVNFQI